MLMLYAVCLIIGGAAIVISIVAGGELDVDADVGDVELDAGVDTMGASGEEVAASARFLSFRTAIFFAAFFGLTGVLFTLLGIGALLTPLFAVGLGWVAAFTIHRLMEFLKRGEVGELEGAQALHGAQAEVLIDIAEGGRGKVSVKRGDRTLQLVAAVHDQAVAREFHVGDEVVIVSFDGGLALVAGEAFLA